MYLYTYSITPSFSLDERKGLTGHSRWTPDKPKGFLDHLPYIVISLWRNPLKSGFKCFCRKDVANVCTTVTPFYCHFSGDYVCHVRSALLYVVSHCNYATNGVGILQGPLWHGLPHMPNGRLSVPDLA